MASILKTESLSKHFGGSQALDGVEFELGRNEIHALVGENGAGKSTLIKILAGIYVPDKGRILCDGEEVIIRTPADSRGLGIAVIHQDFDLAPNLSVADNLLLGREPTRVFGIIDGREHARLAADFLKTLGIRIEPDTPVDELTVGQQQLVAIAKAVSEDARILIMDEPTSALASDEIDRLIELISGLRDSGTSIIFISHKLDEVFRISDRITVLRDGKSVSRLNTGDITVDEVVSMMVGRNVTDLFARNSRPRDDVALEVRDLSRQGAFEGISFSIAKGEVLGLYGLKGAGRTAVAEIVFGLAAADGGKMLLEGRPEAITRPADAVRLGISFVPEDRKGGALIPNMDVKENMTIAALRSFCRHGIIDRAKEQEYVEKQLTVLKIRTSGPDQMIGELSGGNQQKVVLSRWLVERPRVLILDEPTAGIDVGAKADIYGLIDRLTSEGVAILLISSELPEILHVSDRILVMSGGTIVANIPRALATEERIMLAIHSSDSAVSAM